LGRIRVGYYFTFIGLAQQLYLKDKSGDKKATVINVRTGLRIQKPNRLRVRIRNKKLQLSKLKMLG